MNPKKKNANQEKLVILIIDLEDMTPAVCRSRFAHGRRQSQTAATENARIEQSQLCLRAYARKNIVRGKTEREMEGSHRTGEKERETCRGHYPM